MSSARIMNVQRRQGFKSDDITEVEFYGMQVVVKPRSPTRGIDIRVDIQGINHDPDFGESLARVIAAELDRLNRERSASNPRSFDCLIDSLGLRNQAIRSLQRFGVYTVGDLVSCSEKELDGAKDIGKATLRAVKNRLWKRGLRLGMTDLGGWKPASHLPPKIHRHLNRAIEYEWYVGYSLRDNVDQRTYGFVHLGEVAGLKKSPFNRVKTGNVNQVLQGLGLSFGMDIGLWSPPSPLPYR